MIDNNKIPSMIFKIPVCTTKTKTIKKKKMSNI